MYIQGQGIPRPCMNCVHRRRGLDSSEAGPVLGGTRQWDRKSCRGHAQAARWLLCICHPASDASPHALLAGDTLVVFSWPRPLPWHGDPVTDHVFGCDNPQAWPMLL